MVFMKMCRVGRGFRGRSRSFHNLVSSVSISLCSWSVVRSVTGRASCVPSREFSLDSKIVIFFILFFVSFRVEKRDQDGVGSLPSNHIRIEEMKRGIVSIIAIDNSSNIDEKEREKKERKGK